MHGGGYSYSGRNVGILERTWKEWMKKRFRVRTFEAFYQALSDNTDGYDYRNAQGNYGSNDCREEAENTSLSPSWMEEEPM